MLASRGSCEMALKSPTDEREVPSNMSDLAQQ